MPLSPKQPGGRRRNVLLLGRVREGYIGEVLAPSCRKVTKTGLELFEVDEVELLERKTCHRLP